MNKENLLTQIQEEQPVKEADLWSENDVGEFYVILEELLKDNEVEYTNDSPSKLKISKDPSKLQVKADLEDRAVNASEAEWESEYGSPSRLAILKGMLPDFEIESECTGGYQGTYVFRLDGSEYVWLIRDSYGSCSHCDGLIDHPEPYNYGVQMVRNAYAFESEEVAVEYLNLVDNWRWDRVKDLAMKLFNKES